MNDFEKYYKSFEEYYKSPAWLWDKIKHDFREVLPELNGSPEENIKEVVFNRKHNIARSITCYIVKVLPEYAEKLGIKI